MVKAFPDSLINRIKNKIDDLEIEKNIIDYNMSLFIITTIRTAYCLFSFISGICYYCKLKNRYEEIKKEYV